MFYSSSCHCCLSPLERVEFEGRVETAGFCPSRIKNITPNYPKVVLQMFDKVKHAHLQTAAATTTTTAIASARLRSRSPATARRPGRLGSAPRRTRTPRRTRRRRRRKKRGTGPPRHSTLSPLTLPVCSTVLLLLGGLAYLGKGSFYMPTALFLPPSPSPSPSRPPSHSFGRRWRRRRPPRGPIVARQTAPLAPWPRPPRRGGPGRPDDPDLVAARSVKCVYVGGGGGGCLSMSCKALAMLARYALSLSLSLLLGRCRFTGEQLSLSAAVAVAGTGFPTVVEAAFRGSSNSKRERE